MDIDRAGFDSLHDHAFTGEEFVQKAALAHGAEPDRRLWNEVAALLPEGDVLEIGAGSGHALAAAKEAGRRVAAVETSAVHRDYIRQTWGIDDVYATVDELPAERRFPAIFLVNVLEHVYDIEQLLTKLRAHLAPGGAIFISTVNANCVVARLGGTSWSMFKTSDHVSFPSAEGLRRAAVATGLSPRRIWFGELPLETPIGFAVAARDYVRERVLKHQADVRMHDTNIAPSKQSQGDERKQRATRVANGLMKLARNRDITAPIAARLGVAATVKALLE